LRAGVLSYPSTMPSIARRALIGLALLVGLLIVPGAFAKDYRILQATEIFRIQPDGSVLAAETLTFTFNGDFHGAYRLIPSAGAEAIDQVNVAENGVPYAPSGDAHVGSSSADATYGVLQTPEGWTQVAWHFTASYEPRTFTVSYRLLRYVTAYSDVGDLYYQAWGDQWPVMLDHLHAEVIFPTPPTTAEKQSVRIWGHPASVTGRTTILSDRVILDADSVPAHQYVNFEAIFPRRMLTASDYAIHNPNTGLEQIVAREKQVFASPYGTSPAAQAAPSGGSGGGVAGFWKGLLLFLLVPVFLIGRLFGFFRGGGSSGSDGFGGSFGGGGSSSGSGGGGGGAW
jgi:uncharacterized membrane protein